MSVGRGGREREIDGQTQGGSKGGKEIRIYLFYRGLDFVLFLFAGRRSVALWLVRMLSLI